MIKTLFRKRHQPNQLWRTTRWFVVLLWLCVAGLTGSTTVRAQTPQYQRAFVYGINAAFASTYTGNFVPPSTPKIYILADQTSIISPRITQIYYWAITNEYQANWDIINQPVAGTLEIMQAGQLIQQTEPTSYTIHYQPHGSDVHAQLFLGNDALTAQASFTAEQKRFQTEMSAYYIAQQAWTAAADDANQRAQKGEKVTVPPVPQAPEPISVTSNGINQGIPVKLPAGLYQIRLRSKDGTVVPDSARDLVVFAARRAAVGYMVVPETRWTTPDQVDDPSDVIVGMPNSQLYLIPHAAREFPARAYTLLQDPQKQVGENSDWTWVLGEAITDGQLEISTAGKAPERYPLTPYRVRQAEGTTLGYQIQPFVADPTRPKVAPDLTGYPIHIDQPGSGYEIRMVSAQGETLPGSTRLVRAPASIQLNILVVLSAAPLVIGAVILVRRRMKMRLPRNVAG